MQDVIPEAILSYMLYILKVDIFRQSPRSHKILPTFHNFFPPLCVVAEAAQSHSDMAEELSRQLEDILSTYCRESMSDDTSTLPNGQSHSPELNGLTREDNKPEEGKVNGANNGMEKQPRKSQEKKKVKGLGKESFPFKKK